MKFKVAVSVIACAITLTLQGCANTESGSSSSDYSDVDPSLRKDEPSFFSKSGATACAGGALLGGLACLLAKKDNKAICLAAAAAGCALGMASNYALDSIRADHHNQESQLDALTQKLQGTIKETSTLKDNIDSIMASDKATIDKLLEDQKNGTAKQEDLEKQSKRMSANLKYMQDRLKEIQEQKAAAVENLQIISENADGESPVSNPTLAKQKIEKTQEELAKLEKAESDINSRILSYGDASSDFNKQISNSIKAA